jgi:DNA (cytosine-5)-methyltransferase 1
MIVDLFAGPGGWDEGLRLSGVTDVVGLESDADACATAEAAGHLRHRLDVAVADPRDYRGAVGLIASPPCQEFSASRRRAGTQAPAAKLIAAHAAGRPAELPGADLSLQPLRWVDAIRPEWVALEQVPPVLPLWERIGLQLGVWGYSVAVGLLNAADYGVPQIRRRAFLVASRSSPEPRMAAAVPDALLHRLPVAARFPRPTHFDDRIGVPLFGRPWVPMAAAIDRDLPEWTRTRPATTVQGDARIWPPGHKVNADDRARFPDADERYGQRAGADAVRVTVSEAGVLQSFRPDYPWQGSKTKQYEQVGNAVPPLLAKAILAQFVQAREVAA